MRLKLFLLLLVAAAIPSLAQQSSTVKGKLVDSATGAPIAGATVMLDAGGQVVTTGPDGSFVFTTVKPGSDNIFVAAFGYDDFAKSVTISGESVDLGNLGIGGSVVAMFQDDQQDMVFDEGLLEDEEGSVQNIVASGASDNIYYNAASYDFSAMRFRMRGYNSEYQTTYINGLPFNDLARGRFNYSTLGGLNRAFRNRTNTIGLMPSDYGFGDIGGSANISTITRTYAPGFNGSVAYTNSNYMMRAMAMYSTGISERGWGATIAGIGRYADEGVIPGTFYNSGGLFLSVEKQFSPAHALVLTAFG
ncbi:MAG: TonB-dependent receptor, partial [Paramuribaculum sp.]|nr:TonB-dependent receptor [Paramuribaculum sp.]